jgi:hypothetical protein
MSGFDLRQGQDSLKVLDPEWPIREADIAQCGRLATQKTTSCVALKAVLNFNRYCTLVFGTRRTWRYWSGITAFLGRAANGD